MYTPTAIRGFGKIAGAVCGFSRRRSAGGRLSLLRHCSERQVEWQSGSRANLNTQHGTPQGGRATEATNPKDQGATPAISFEGRSEPLMWEV